MTDEQALELARLLDLYFSEMTDDPAEMSAAAVALDCIDSQQSPVAADDPIRERWL